jgi:hypothetical protein
MRQSSADRPLTQHSSGQAGVWFPGKLSFSSPQLAAEFGCYAFLSKDLNGGDKMIALHKLFDKIQAEKEIIEQVQLFEHEVYKLIPDTKNSYREDSGNTTTKTIKHSNIYARPKGGGNQLYAVNTDGTGHDGSSGIEIPSSHANYFRSKGYKINTDNLLENFYIGDIKNEDFDLILLEMSDES